MLNQKGVGVVVGRFQVPELHEAHKQIINIAKLSHKNYIVFIACTSVKGSDRDPLDFDTRAAMVRYQFPDAIIKPIHDNPCDKAWSKNLDGEIVSLFGKTPVTLYSGDKGFADNYHGRYKVKQFKEINFYRGTELREIQGKIVPTTKEGRCGVIYGVVNQYPRVYFTTDTAVIKNLRNGKKLVLLGEKPNLPGLRFPGGFVDPSDKTLELSAKREVFEECGGIETSDFQYVMSTIIDDWRYKVRPEKVMTTFFRCTYMYGDYTAGIKAKDAEFFSLKFYPLDKTTLAKMSGNHAILMKALLNYEHSHNPIEKQPEEETYTDNQILERI